MNILVIGSGGREHTLGWKMKQSAHADKLFFIPGNAGTSSLGTNININPNDFEAVKREVLSNSVDMVVVGPEEPLVLGIVDFFEADAQLSKVKIIGPSKEGARLEGSKEYAKQFMFRHNIPTARYLSVSLNNMEEGKAFLKQLQPPYVLKADGLAAGKGVLILDNYDEACSELNNMLNGKFGAAGKTVVIEEFLSGIELSVFALTDGKDYVLLPEAKDYKRIGEGDAGLNTGGMGAVSPVPFANETFMEKVKQRIIIPTVNGLRKEAISYKGFVFFGLIKVGDEPYVIEYNVRMGDPETEVVMPRLKNDLVEMFVSTATGKLSSISVDSDERTTVTVVLVSGGYPGNYKKGTPIYNTDEVDDSMLFHSGTDVKNGEIVTNGGRVFAVTSFGTNIVSARNQCLKNADVVNYEGKYYRKDIGFDLI